MTIRRYLGTASVVCSLALGLSGSAFAADVSFDTTGPDSNQKVVIDNSSDVHVNNDNYVQVTNFSDQSASTGDVSADKNTSVGGLASGDATNNHGTSTTVNVSNESAALPVGGNGENVGNNNGNPVGVGGQGGSVLGASTGGGLGGAAILPVTGPSSPVDVSALRAAWHPQTTAPTSTLAKGSRIFTGAMLLTATLLSLLGATLSAVYARRREMRV